MTERRLAIAAVLLVLIALEALRTTLPLVADGTFWASAMVLGKGLFTIPLTAAFGVERRPRKGRISFLWRRALKLI